MTEENHEIDQQPEDVEQPALHIGRTLAAERERQQRSLADVARALRLGVKQIEALESNDFAALPGNTFVRGFIRNYARLLEMDADRLLQAFQQKAPEEAHAVSVPPRGGEFSPYPSKRWVWYAAAVLLMVLGGPMLVYSLLSENDAPPVPAKPKSAQVPVPPVQQAVVPSAVSAPKSETGQPLLPPPAETAQAAPLAGPKTEMAPLAAGAARLIFKFEGESWVEVRDKDGERLLGQLNPAGTEQVAEGMPPFKLVIGNAAQVKVLFDGKQVDLAPYIDVDVARLTLNK